MTPTPELPRPMSLLVFMLVEIAPVEVNGLGATVMGAVAVILVTVPVPPGAIHERTPLVFELRINPLVPGLPKAASQTDAGSEVLAGMSPKLMAANKSKAVTMRAKAVIKLRFM